MAMQSNLLVLVKTWYLRPPFIFRVELYYWNKQFCVLTNPHLHFGATSLASSAGNLVATPKVLESHWRPTCCHCYMMEVVVPTTQPVAFQQPVFHIIKEPLSSGRLHFACMLPYVGRAGRLSMQLQFHSAFILKIAAGRKKNNQNQNNP